MVHMTHLLFLTLPHCYTPPLQILSTPIQRSARTAGAKPPQRSSSKPGATVISTSTAATSVKKTGKTSLTPSTPPPPLKPPKLTSNARTASTPSRRSTSKKKKSKLPLLSKWPFYSHLHNLFAATATAPPSVKHKSSSLPLHKLPSVKPYRRSEKLNPLHPNIYYGGSSSRSHGDNDGYRGDSHAHNDDDDDTVFDEDDARKHRVVQDSSDGAAFRELARLILKFGEVYERIESSKQQQMMDLERQRMEFTMEAQLGLEKIKRPKYSSRTGKKL